MEDIVRRVEDIFGKGSGQDIETEWTNQSIAKRIEEMAKREEQFDEWEKMKQNAKRRQREDRRLNLFWRRNKTFPHSLEEQKKLQMRNKHSCSGGVSTIRK